MKKTNGYVIYENHRLVVIATGFTRKSANRKTGNMIQIWILVKAQNPVKAVLSGLDEIICGDCPFRGEICYVNVGQAPLAIHKTWLNGGYGYAGTFDNKTGEWIPDKAMLARLFSGVSTRFGAYGDPVNIPLPIVKRIADHSSNWTGYTHQWKAINNQAYREYFMASTDTEEQKITAHEMGWRSFRVIDDGENPSNGEIVCPNYTHGVQCADCGLCKGKGSKAKSIVITAHGSKKKKFSKVRDYVSNPLDSMSPAQKIIGERLMEKQNNYTVTV